MIVVRDREAGNIIEEVATIEEGMALIKEYEESDKADGIYEKDFYEVAEFYKYTVCDSKGNELMATDNLSDAVNCVYERNESLSDEEKDDVEKTYFILDEKGNGVDC